MGRRGPPGDGRGCPKSRPFPPPRWKGRRDRLPPDLRRAPAVEEAARRRRPADLRPGHLAHIRRSGSLWSARLRGACARKLITPEVARTLAVRCRTHLTSRALSRRMPVLKSVEL